MKLNKKADEQRMKEFTNALISGQKEISTKQIVDDFISDTIQQIRRVNISKDADSKFNGYLKRKTKEAYRFESNYYKYKKKLMSSDKSQEEIDTKLEIAFGKVCELWEDIEILENYKK
tara:strand:+ start:138 stop:491 length:354 start_codon:yes stop_codon:yes gene_type:complete